MKRERKKRGDREKENLRDKREREKERGEQQVREGDKTSMKKSNSHSYLSTLLLQRRKTKLRNSKKAFGGFFGLHKNNFRD